MGAFVSFGPLISYSGNKIDSESGQQPGIS
jgi:hypothetical protein